MVGTTVILFPVNLDAPFNGTTYNVPAGVSTHLITGLTPGGGYTVTQVAAGATETVSVSSGGNETADSGGVLRVLTRPVAVQTVVISTGGYRLQLRIAPANGQAVRIETSVDLRMWISLGLARPSPSGSLEFTEAAPGGSSTRFYRAASP
jgi:hypothetical protein